MQELEELENRERENMEGKNLDTLRKEQLACQVLAVIAADWHKPTPEDTLNVLEAAQWRVKDAMREKQATTPRQGE